jgi:hypothetical protein
MDKGKESSELRNGVVALTKKRWADRPIHIWLYQMGIALLILSLLMFFIDAGSLSEQLLMGAAVIALTTAFLKDLYAWVEPHLESRPVKNALFVFGLTCTAVATGLSQVTIGSTTGQDPTLFPTTIAVLATISFAYVIAGAAVIVGTVALAFVALVALAFFVIDQFIAFFTNFGIMLRGRTDFERKPLSKRLERAFPHLSLPLVWMRIVAGVAVIIACSYVLQPSSLVSEGVRWIAGTSAYMFDLHSDSSCSSIPGDRIRRINDTVVVIGRQTSAGFAFARKRCDLAEQAAALPPPRHQIGRSVSSSELSH